MKGRFIAVEGLSAVGKSTVAKLLAGELNAKLMRTIPLEFNDLRKFVDSRRSIDARFCLFLSAIFCVAEEIESVLQEGNNVVVESYIYRTIAFHQGMGSNLSIEVPRNLITPNYTFLLTCDEEERERRRKARSPKGSIYYWEQLSEENATMILQEYARFPVHTIDTTNVPPEGVVEAIFDFLKE